MKEKFRIFFLATLSALLISPAMAQERTISGRVTSAVDQSALGGVSVSVQGTNRATQTNDAGNFSIAASTGETLLFRAIGFADQTAMVTSSAIVNVVLQQETQDIDEVVVIGYGSVKKSDFTGSAVTVGAQDIDRRPISNVMSALQGSGPGIQATTPTRSPGASPTFRIRGIGSYSAESDPLIIVDGAEFTGGTANLNPADIETMTVLKDAATISMYGSRGANGVIMITTKRGDRERTRLDVQVQLGANENMMPRYDVVSPGEYYELMWEAYKNSLIYGPESVPADVAAQLASGTMPRNAAGLQTYDGITYQDIVQYLGNYNAFNVPKEQLVSTDGRLNPNASLLYADDLDWESQAARRGKRNEYGLSYASGFGKSDLFVSLNYLDEEGWALNSDFETIRARVNLNTEVRDWFRTGVNINANANKYNNNSFGTGIVNPFYFAREIGPIYPVHVHDPVTGQFILDERGNRIYDLGNLSAEYGLSRPFNSGRHAIAENLWNLDAYTRDFIGGRGYVEFDILPWMTFHSTLAVDLRNQREEAYQNTIVGDGAPAGRYSQAWNRRLQWTFYQYLNLNKSFGLHNLSGTLGHESVNYKNENISGLRQGEGFQNFYTFTNFTDINSLTSGLGEYAMESYFARANYDFDHKYYLSASVRYDGDSKMPQLNRWSTFWSLGAAWRIENEAFFDVPWVNALKLRASYGRLGNNNFGVNNADFYPYQPGYGIGVNNVGFPGTTLSALGSPDLRWEGQKPLDLGLEFALFNSRLTGEFEYYHRTSDGLLFSVPQPYHNGATTGGSFSIRRNVGDMLNSGIELSLTGGIMRKTDFNWDLTLNVTTLRNEILAMPVETPFIVSSPYRREKGYSIYEYYTREFYGVDPENGNVLYRNVVEDANLESPSIRFIDQGNGRVDTVTSDHNLARQDWLGKQGLPDAYGSIINRFSYKNFDFGFVLAYSIGGYVMDGPYSTFMSPGPSNGSNLHRDLLKGWRSPGDITDIPRMDLNRTAPFGAASSRWLTSASYLGISTINVAYRIPEAVSARAYLSRARVFVSAENLQYWTARKGLNSMTNISGASGTTSYSPARTINIGINFGL